MQIQVYIAVTLDEVTRLMLWYVMLCVATELTTMHYTYLAAIFWLCVTVWDKVRYPLTNVVKERPFYEVKLLLANVLHKGVAP